MNRRPATLLLIPAILVATVPPAPASGNTEAASKQYRVARRLAVEGSPQAAEALRRVVELDPDGELADDALLDLADLNRVPLWPEEIGRASAEDVARALSVLDELAGQHSGGDRVVEARLRMGLLRLEPITGRDSERARVDLLAAATATPQNEWTSRARYSLAWLDEIDGRLERARATYHRLIIDQPGMPASARARTGLGRLALEAGEFGRAARWFQEALEGEGEAGNRAARLRELAVRGLLRSSDAGGRWQARGAERHETGVRNAGGMAVLPDGGWLLADRGADAVIRFDANGKRDATWAVEDVRAVCTDPFGRGFAASADRVYRLDAGTPAVVVDVEDLSPVSGLAVDASGGIWVADRRGDRVGRVESSSGRLRVVWEGDGVRLAHPAWDGRRLVGLNARARSPIAISEDGTTGGIGSSVFVKPVGLAVDRADQVAVLDAKSMVVVLLGPDGEERDRLSLEPAGISRPAEIALGLDGSLSVLDGSSGALVRFP